MPYRSFGLFVAVFGAVFVVGLILLGLDLRRAAKTGPGWKRKLVAAGLVLLGVVGITSGCSQIGEVAGGIAVAGVDPDAPIPAGAALDETKQWQAVLSAWKAVAPLARTGKSTTVQREVVDKKLEAAKKCITRLTDSRLLSEAESQLLVSEAERLRSEMYRNPPTGCQVTQVTCYAMAFIPPAQESMERLTKRLPLLKQMATDGKVQAAVLAKVVGSVEADMATLASEAELKHIPADQHEQAAELRKSAEATVAEIKGLLEASNE